VLLVDQDNKVQYREVKLGDQQQGLRVIAEGLQPGDRIVVNGIQRVRPGDAVSPHLVQMSSGTTSTKGAS
jgi:multidrug efflux system membrane fusion protein